MGSCDAGYTPAPVSPLSAFAAGLARLLGIILEGLAAIVIALLLLALVLLAATLL